MENGKDAKHKMSNPAIALPRPSLADLLRLVGLPSKAQADRAQEAGGTANQVVLTVISVVDDLVSTALEKRTAQDFANVRLEVFPHYFAAMRALGDLAAIVLPSQTIERLSAEWFCELEADLRDLGPSTFGSDLTERGIFTVWNLRKIRDLAQEIRTGAFPKGNEVKDSELGLDFAAKALWTRFHVDCLTKAMRQKLPIYPEVVEPIREGLRAAVNTYACIRQWTDLRNPRPEPELGAVEWTDDDERLLADSMRDLEQESA